MPCENNLQHLAYLEETILEALRSRWRTYKIVIGIKEEKEHFNA